MCVGGGCAEKSEDLPHFSGGGAPPPQLKSGGVSPAGASTPLPASLQGKATPTPATAWLRPPLPYLRASLPAGGPKLLGEARPSPAKAGTTSGWVTSQRASLSPPGPAPPSLPLDSRPLTDGPARAAKRRAARRCRHEGGRLLRSRMHRQDGEDTGRASSFAVCHPILLWDPSSQIVQKHACLRTVSTWTHTVVKLH